MRNSVAQTRMMKVTIFPIAPSSVASRWPEDAHSMCRDQSSRPKTTRKGRSFPHLKLVIIWRAILSCRSAAWRQGDTAPFGSIRRAHDQAVAACRAAGLAPPRYRTVYVLWHRGVPSADVVAALRDERQHSMG